MITRHRRAAAMLVPIDMAERLGAPDRRSFADFLLSIPAGIEIERDTTPLRSIDL